MATTKTTAKKPAAKKTTAKKQQVKSRQPKRELTGAIFHSATKKLLRAM